MFFVNWNILSGKYTSKWTDILLNTYPFKRWIDFVAIKNNKKIYVQVCRNLPESSNRELENLKEIKDNYHKYIVTLDKYDESTIDGVEIIYLEKFLLKDEL